MIWVSRLAFVVAWYIVGLAFMALYAGALLFVTSFVLGITNETFRTIQFGVCLVAGYVTAFVVMRKSWPRRTVEPTVDRIAELSHGTDEHSR